jgi:hypothetical protein
MQDGILSTFYRYLINEKPLYRYGVSQQQLENRYSVSLAKGVHTRQPAGRRSFQIGGAFPPALKPALYLLELRHGCSRALSKQR